MPGTTRTARAAVAVAAVLAATATACGGGGDGGGGDGVLSSSWGDPRTPGARQHQRGPGRQGPRHGLPGPQAVRPGDGRGAGHGRREDRDDRLAELHRHPQGRLDLQQRREGHRPLLRRRVELRRPHRQQAEQRPVLLRHRRLRGRAPRVRRRQGEDHARTRRQGRPHLHRRPEGQVLHLAGDPRLPGVHAAAAGVLHRPRGVAGQARRQRPVHRGLVHPGQRDETAPLGRLPGTRQGPQRGVDLRVYTDNNTAYQT